MKERKAKKGHWLTQVQLDDEALRIFVKAVAGYGDLDALYKEVSDDYKAAWEAEHPADEPEE